MQRHVSMGNIERRAAKYNRATEPNRQWVIIQIYLCKYTFPCTVYTCFPLLEFFLIILQNFSDRSIFFFCSCGRQQSFKSKNAKFVRLKMPARSCTVVFFHTPCWQTLNQSVVVSGDVWCLSPLAIYRKKKTEWMWLTLSGLFLLISVCVFYG